MSYKCSEKEKESSRKRNIKNYYKDVDVSRAKCRERKRKAREQRRDEINAYQRNNYSSKRAENARKQNDRRIKRLPFRGLRRAIQSCENGTQDIHGLIKLLRERLAWSDGRNDSTA